MHIDVLEEKKGKEPVLLQKVGLLVLLVGMIEATLFAFGLGSNLAVQALSLFPTILVGFGLWHHDKGVILVVGFACLLAFFFLTPREIGGHGHGEVDAVETRVPVFEDLLTHFANPHVAEILYELTALLLGFALFSRYFDKSGMSNAAARFVMADLSSVNLNWVPALARLLMVVYTMSIGLDNIAAALIGGLIVGALYRGQGFVPFILLVGIIAASNLGGAASAIGDTTTTMVYISGVSFLALAKGFVGTLVAQLALVFYVLWAVRGHEPKRQTQLVDATVEEKGHTDTSLLQWMILGVLVGGWIFLRLHTGLGILCLFLFMIIVEARRVLSGHADAGHTADLGSTTINWPQLFPLLGIPGLVIGNLQFHQPGLGLWAGLLLGVLIGKICALVTRKAPVRLEVDAVIGAVPGTAFLVLLVACAKLLPLDTLKPLMAQADSTAVTWVLGVASALFDNIPLTAIAIQMGGFDWALLSYAVGFGGSMLWIGSSAGVALGQQYPEVYDTKRWLKPIGWLFAIYNIGFWAILLFWGYLIPSLQPMIQPLLESQFVQSFWPLAAAGLFGAASGLCWMNADQKIGKFRKVMAVVFAVACIALVFLFFVLL